MVPAQGRERVGMAPVALERVRDRVLVPLHYRVAEGAEDPGVLAH
jgi:hypothetical protein